MNWTPWIESLVIVIALGACEKAEKGASTPAVADSVTLGYRVLDVGATRTNVFTMDMDAKMSAQGKQLTMTSSQRKKDTIEVLGTSAEAVTKAKVSYLQLDKKQVMMGQEKVEPSPIVGKTYIVEAKDGTIVVTTEAGDPVPSAEADAVRDEDDDFGEPDKMAKVLAGRTFRRDQMVEIPPENLAGLFGDEKEGKLVRFALTFTGTRGTLAQFAAAADLELGRGAVSIKIALAGTAVIDPANGELNEIAMEGPMTFTGQVTGSGTMRASGSSAK